MQFQTEVELSIGDAICIAGYVLSLTDIESGSNSSPGNNILAALFHLGSDGYHSEESPKGFDREELNRVEMNDAELNEVVLQSMESSW